jgi:hypothetical protein
LAGTLARLIPHLDWRHSGLGMLQAYLHEGDTEELRVHVWHPSLRRAGIEESGLLHDHRFDLYSRVLVGTIKQAEFELVTHSDGTGDWQLHEVVHARAADRHGMNDGNVTALPTRYTLTRQVKTIVEGRGYFFPKRVFHGTYVDGLAVTVVSKSNQEDVPARILAPYGAPVVHAFAEPLPPSAWALPLEHAVVALTRVWRRT